MMEPGSLISDWKNTGGREILQHNNFKCTQRTTGMKRIIAIFDLAIFRFNIVQ